MQEQHHYNITSDEGWSKMKPLLDREMPVSRRSRRFIFFWWSMAASVIIGVAFWSLYKGSDSSLPGPSPLSEPIAITQQNTLKTDDADNTQTPSSVDAMSNNLTSGEKENILSPVDKSETISRINNSSHQTPVKKTTPKSDLQNTDANTGLVSTAETGKTPVPGTGAGKETFTDNTSVIVTERITSSDLEPLGEYTARNAEITSVLLPLQIGAVHETSDKNIFIQTIPYHISKRGQPRFEPTVSLSGMAGQYGSMSYSGGVGLNTNLNSKFSLTTEIGFTSFRPDVTLFGASRDASLNTESIEILSHDPAFQGIGAYIPGELVNADASYNAINPFIDQVHQWQISMGLKWKFSRRFFTSGGVRLGFGTRATSTYPIVALDNSSASPLDASIGNSLDRFEIIRTQMTSLYGGLGYRLGKHLDITALWTHGLDPYLLNDIPDNSLQKSSVTRTDFIRGLNMGISYTF